MSKFFRAFQTSVLISLATTCLVPTESSAAPGEVAILSGTDSGGLASYEAQAIQALGLVPILLSPATWATMTTADFASYEGVVLADPRCKTNDAPIAAAASNNAWTAAVDGNVLIVGSDPVWHATYSSGTTSVGALKLIDNAVAFALDEAGTGKVGAYISLSCYYHSAVASTAVPALGGFGDFTVIGGGYLPGLNDVYIVASHDSLNGLTDADLSNWGDSVHEAFVTWPSNFEVLALAVDAQGAFTSADGTLGYPYILARGIIPDWCGDGAVNPGEECDDGNNTDGDGCDQACNIESCPDADGDGVCDSEDVCPGFDDRIDSDMDLVPDGCDICQGSDQTGDTDKDGLCDDLDACPLDPENDVDGDGVCANDDNCPADANPDQNDVDGDGIGDVCDDDNGNGDEDNDGVLDVNDQCPGTKAGDAINQNGCSIDQLCPCENNWKNHGAYVVCVTRAVKSFAISCFKKGAIIAAAAWSSCGVKKHPPYHHGGC